MTLLEIEDSGHDQLGTGNSELGIMELSHSSFIASIAFARELRLVPMPPIRDRRSGSAIRDTIQVGSSQVREEKIGFVAER